MKKLEYEKVFETVRMFIKHSPKDTVATRNITNVNVPDGDLTVILKCLVMAVVAEINEAIPLTKEEEAMGKYFKTINETSLSKEDE